MVRPIRPVRSRAVAVLVAVTLGLASAGAGPAFARASSASAPSTASAGRRATAVLAQMTLRERVGQVFMVGTPATGPNAATLREISGFHVGNVMLTGRSYAGTGAPAGIAAAAQRRATTPATDRVRLLVATDQEGGQVQVLHGRGISEMPSALQQGRWSPARLRAAASTWAGQLRASGVNMDLGPVLDTVPGPRAAAGNPPIGAFDREFGYTPAVVAQHGEAFMLGMSTHGLAPTLKHFPGLGRVHQNTDTSTGVTDYLTTRHDPYLTPFATSIRAGAPAVMMSLAFYARLDPRNPAVFSPFVIGTVLRHDLAFHGVVISDDLANARQVSPWSPGTRAVKFLAAGGDLVLTVNPSLLPAMYRAVLTRARHDPGFRARVNQAALRVLQLKQARGLL